MSEKGRLEEATLWKHPADCENPRCELGETAFPLKDGFPSMRALLQCGCLPDRGLMACPRCEAMMDAVTIPDGHVHVWAALQRRPDSPVICYACLTTGPASLAEGDG